MTQDQGWEKQSLLQPKLCGSELAFTHKFSKADIFFISQFQCEEVTKGAYFRKRGGQVHVVYAYSRTEQRKSHDGLRVY